MMRFMFWLRVCRLILAAPRRERMKIFSLLRIYRVLDQEVRRFQKATGLRCLPSCGHCCENPAVETTVFEILPLAVDLWRRNLAETYLARLAGLKTMTSCLFYQSDISAQAVGHCREYQLRPAICRLFGFSTRKDKAGQAELVTCGLIKEKFPVEYQKACQKIKAGLSTPHLSDAARQIAALDLPLGQERLPINQALQEALERVGFEYDMQRKGK